MYCENCGLQIFPERPRCTRCGHAPTQQVVQLLALTVLLLAIIGNSLTGWLLLPKLVSTHPHYLFFRAWLWTDLNGAQYGWMPLAAGLLTWEWFVWRKTRKKRQTMPKIKGWLSRKALSFVLAAGFAPIVPWWIPIGQPSDKALAALASYPGLPSVVSWSAVLVVAMVLCTKADTRDLVLGRGKVLSIVSVSCLALFMTLTIIAWSFT